MAVVKEKQTPEFLLRLRDALTGTLEKQGIDAEVEFEKIPATKLYRVWIVAPQFEKLWHSERQEMVWRIAEKVLKPEEQLRISMILTLEPDNGSQGT